MSGTMRLPTNIVQIEARIVANSGAIGKVRNKELNNVSRQGRVHMTHQGLLGYWAILTLFKPHRPLQGAASTLLMVFECVNAGLSWR